MAENKDTKDEQIVNENEAGTSESTENTENVEGTENTEKQEELSVEEQLTADLAKEKDKFLRLFAEFENYKRRTSKERIELYASANKELMTVLLPVLDDFDRGINEIKKAGEDSELFKGMELIQGKLQSTLEQKGLSKVEIKAGDTFDADIHEAITQIPAPSKKMKGKVIDVIEQGYQLGSRIIRFPKVVIGQ
ncbi:MAG: nucleotide exchange factor GrpE [Flavobacteriaceae bacterium]|nr:MAG: nucleotide exchange factor GrpE [Flavobacteriaceae bacterium]